MKIINKKSIISVAIAILSLYSAANAEITFVSASNSASLVNTIEDSESRVFVFGGIADGQATDLSFTTDSTCPGVAMTGGAEFTAKWSCTGGIISATVTNRGGMSFGPASEENAGTFYVTFSNPPAPPGSVTPPASLTGIQISVFGDVSKWDLSGEATSAGAQFGVELSGSQGGDAHFYMELPQPAVEFLGGVLGVYVGGKPDPFAGITVNDDGSVSLKVDIASLSQTGLSTSNVNSKATIVTKKITTGERILNIAFSKNSLKSGQSASLALCAGTEFTAGDKIRASFILGSKVLGIKKTFTLDSNGCAKGSVKLKSVSAGTITAKIAYEGSKAKGSAKVTK